MSNRVAVIGSGNVAEALSLAISANDRYDLVQLWARNVDRGRLIASLAGCVYENDPQKLAAADIYIISVSDRAIREISEQFDFGDAIVVHTSGSCGADELSSVIPRQGVLYPLQTFTAGRTVDFQEIPFFVEAADDESFRAIFSLASALSGSVYRSDPELRRRLHVAAVFVCNFVNHMYVAGEQLMQENGLDYGLLKPLIAETIRKMLTSPSPRPLQTGPAVREDYPTIEKHMALLDNNPRLRDLYRMITESIISDKKNNS